MDIIEKNQQRMFKLSSQSPHLAKQVEELDWSELESALEECIFTKDEIGLPKDYGPATYSVSYTHLTLPTTPYV